MIPVLIWTRFCNADCGVQRSKKGRSSPISVQSRNPSLYVAFQFAAAEQHEDVMMMRAHDSDVLKKVSIFRWMQGCL
jgi:hypothetical protein